MSFTDGKPRIATEKDCSGKWGGELDGKRFRCYLCGYRFVVGDYWRFVFDNDGCGSRHGNFLVCRNCDGKDIRERWKKHCEEAEMKYWWL